MLRIASGDIIDVDTLLTNTPRGLERAGVKPEDIQPSLRAIVDRVTDKGPGGHILTGPSMSRGPSPGTRSKSACSRSICRSPTATTAAADSCRRTASRTAREIIPLDRKKMTAAFAPGIVIPLRPFFGSMGVAPPPSAGRISSNPPGIHAGNLDNKELVAGTTLFIPVHVTGALFEVGDGHAAQGDGEVDQTAIETSLRGRLQLTVRKGMTLAWPRAETPTHYISMGTDEDLTKPPRRSRFRR